MDLCLDEDEIYQMQCGEMFFTTKGRLIFHCTLCEKKFDGFELYELHIKEHIVPTFNDDDDQTKDVHIKEHTTSNFVDEQNDNVEKEDDLYEMMEDDDRTFATDFEIFEEQPCDITTVKTENVLIEEALTNETKISDSKREEQHKAKSKSTTFKKFRKNGKTNTTTTIKPKEISNERVLVAVRDVQPRVFPRSLLTPEEERKHRCPICNTGFKDKNNMIYHLKRHTDKKDHKCPECDKAFYTSSEVRIHLRSHKSERPYLCSECGRSFVSNSHLTAHLKRHANQRNYKCEVCGKAFFDKSQLSGHMVGHSSERPFSCEICSASFSRQKALKNHLKLHDNKKEYECELCDSRFNQRAGLFSHMKTSHKSV